MQLLKGVIYSADGSQKFVLEGFPNSIEEAKVFEESVCNIAANIY